MDRHSEQNTSSVEPGPGKTLHQARLDLGLSPEDVALQLHLAARQIIALENDDYKNLPQPTYVRGYLRNYALLLGLSPEPLLEAYTRFHKKSTAAPTKAMPAKEQAVGKENQIKYVTYLMGAIIVGLTAAWWQGRDSSAPVPQNTSSIETPALPAGQDSSPAPEKSDKPAPSERSLALSGVKEPKEPLMRGIASVPPGASVSPGSAGFPKPQTVLENRSAVSGRDETRARMVLRAEQDCWVDIRDAKQTRLLYETILAGRVVTVEGTAPFNVFLGNAGGIKLEYNGKPYDVSRHKNGLVARFTLGGTNPPNRPPAQPVAPPQATAPTQANAPVPGPQVNAPNEIHPPSEGNAPNPVNPPSQ